LGDTVYLHAKFGTDHLTPGDVRSDASF